MDSAIFVQLIISGLLIGFVFSLIAVGLTLIFGLMNILNLAHGAFFTLGAYCGLAAATATGSFWLAHAARPRNAAAARAE